MRLASRVHRPTRQGITRTRWNGLTWHRRAVGNSRRAGGVRPAGHISRWLRTSNLSIACTSTFPSHFHKLDPSRPNITGSHWDSNCIELSGKVGSLGSEEGNGQTSSSEQRRTVEIIASPGGASDWTVGRDWVESWAARR